MKIVLRQPAEPVCSCSIVAVPSAREIYLFVKKKAAKIKEIRRSWHRKRSCKPENIYERIASETYQLLQIAEILQNSSAKTSSKLPPIRAKICRNYPASEQVSGLGASFRLQGEAGDQARRLLYRRLPSRARPEAPRCLVLRPP